MKMYDIGTSFPSQKKTFAQKNEDWRKACVNNAENIAIWRNDGVRQSYRNKAINYNLYSGILDQADLEKICNPGGVKGLYSPSSIEYYPIGNAKIDLLVGESVNRRFEFTVKTINDEAISLKEKELSSKFEELFVSHINKGKEVKEEDIEKDLKNFENFKNFEYQDIRERNATMILKYLYKHQELDFKFAQGFKDMLISSEQIYECDIIAGEPIVKRLNPKNVFTVRSGESPFIEDADIIVISGYMSPGQIIDEYHEYLTPKQIDHIESGMVGNYGGENKSIDIGRPTDLTLKVQDGINLTYLENGLTWGSTFDEQGNIKVNKVRWKSIRKLKQVKYYDDFGDEQYELFDENYKIDKTKGEEEEVIWVSEWWEGHKIGGTGLGSNDSGAIFVKMQPRPVQFRSLENPSKCHPGVVGLAANTNDNTAVSLMDKMKPYIYLYQILSYNAKLAISKNYGKIMRMDLSQIPENWKIEKWMHYAKTMNIAVTDSFKEGNKGAAMGKIAGSVSPQSPVIDMEMGNTINLYIQMMEFIKQELGEISGVSQARQGQIAQRAAVGNTEREVNQSSHITEYWFMLHDRVKLKVLECLLDTAKYAWRSKKNKKVPFVLDDGAATLFEIDGEQINEAEYGILVANLSSSYELKETIKQLAHAGLQTGALNFSQLLDILHTDSLASQRRKLQRSEQEKQELEQQKQKQQNELQQQAMQMQAEEKEKDREFKREEWDREDLRLERDIEGKKELKIIELEAKAFDGEEGLDTISLEQLKLQSEKLNKEYSLKKEQIEETKRHNKATENKQKSSN
jgi:hypothetical protein